MVRRGTLGPMDLTPPDDTETEDTPHHGEYWSVSQFSAETGRARETITRRIGNAGVKAWGKGHTKNGLVYRCRDVFPLLYSTDDSGAVDPDKLEPHTRLSHFKAEKAKIDLQVAAKELIPRDDYLAELSRVLKLVKQAFDTLPDVLERDCGLTPDQVARVEATCDPVRDALAEEIARIPEQPPTPEQLAATLFA